MYAISLALLLAAIATLLVGFLQDGLTLVLVSIGASVVSAGFLVASVVRRPATAPARTPEEGIVEGDAARGAAAGSDAGAEAPGPAAVVALPDSGTFHRPECRHAERRNHADRVALETARRRGYVPCGVCRPAG